ncbi:MAG TPA: CPBP family intramembrane metalloprotease [Anaerohalosphaeraceae bacterium]|nr:CPBP family intramembrane metalloprotease [Anaerohalosphaeraceae bacterium]
MPCEKEEAPAERVKMSRKRKHRDSFRQLMTFVPDTYMDRTSRPIYALVYLLGFILLYEMGTYLIDPAALSERLAQPQTRVVAFLWVQNVLEYLGFSPRMIWVATPLVPLVILLIFQITSKSPWRIHWPDFLPMTGECLLLSVPLIVLSLLLNRTTEISSNAALLLSSAVGLARQELWLQVITGIGAGIYEELVFRLILIGVLMLLFQDILGFTRKQSVIGAVLVSAFLFSVHHHVFFVNGRLGTGEAFEGSKFFFRMIAGVYFAVLYAFRGFGITAGTHAFYDILAAVLNLLVFQ